MQSRQLGATGPLVSAVGLGCMGMSGMMYGPADRAESIATLRAALDAGITLFDTGDFYGMGHNEMLIGEVLRGLPRDRFIISVKFGVVRDPSGAIRRFDGRPDAVKNFLAYSLQRLGLEYLDIYRPARLDPSVPIEDTVGAIADMVKAGYVRHIGLSEVGSESLRKASAVHAICDLQIEYSLISRGIENGLLATCRSLGVGVTAYGVLAAGLISGHWRKDAVLPGDRRAERPRFQDENLEKNLLLVDALRRVATAKGVTVAQLAIAWVASRGSDVVPVIGSRRRDQLIEALGALDIELTAQDRGELERAIPKDAAAGDRYPPALMAALDSERSR
jgi:aryl-alcohol dehydrogenase-like predicted oxidoreductase